MLLNISSPQLFMAHRAHIRTYRCVCFVYFLFGTSAKCIFGRGI